LATTSASLSQVEQTAVAPTVEVMLHRGKGQKILRQGVPLATGRRDVLHRFPQRAQGMLEGRPTLRLSARSGATTAHSSSVLSLA
jgi:hypothetical protein